MEGGVKELSLYHVNSQVSLLWFIQYCLAIITVLFICPGIYYYVIQVHKADPASKVCKDKLHQKLRGGSCIFESKWQYLELIKV